MISIKTQMEFINPQPRHLDGPKNILSWFSPGLTRNWPVQLSNS